MKADDSIYTDGSYLSNNPQWHAEDSAWKAQNIYRMLTKNQLSPYRVCEVGCGAGEILKQLSLLMGNEVEFVGYEMSPQAFQICSKRTGKNVSFVHKDMPENGGDPFELVLVIDVVEHVEDFYGFLRTVRQKGTYKIFHIPLDLSVLSVLRVHPVVNIRKIAGHLHYFTKETALAALEDTGYEILDYFYTKTELELPNRSWKATCMKLPRRTLFALAPDSTVRILGGFSMMVLCR